MAPDGGVAANQASRSSAGTGDNSAKLCRFKAQVLFESDTDSMAERQSAVSSRSSSQTAGAKRPRKELVSETSYSHSGPLANQKASGAPVEQRARLVDGGAQFKSAGGGTGGAATPLMPSWDYSLRVNRMRGNKVDSKVK